MESILEIPKKDESMYWKIWKFAFNKTGYGSCTCERLVIEGGKLVVVPDEQRLLK